MRKRKSTRRREVSPPSPGGRVCYPFAVDAWGDDTGTSAGSLRTRVELSTIGLAAFLNELLTFVSPGSPVPEWLQASKRR